MHSAIRLFDRGVVQLGAQAGLDIGQILLPQGLLLGLFGGVLGAGAAWALCALLGSFGGAALSLSWQTAGIAALAAALLSWLSGRLGASGVRK